jgi:hypothetical protein
MEALFPLGQIVATPGALDALTRADQTPSEFLCRHSAGGWGQLDVHDTAENLYGLKYGFRVLSSYRTNAGDTLWLITEADRANTTILLPKEY